MSGSVMSKSSVQRRMMVDCQLRTYDITDSRTRHNGRYTP